MTLNTIASASWLGLLLSLFLECFKAAYCHGITIYSALILVILLAKSSKTMCTDVLCIANIVLGVIWVISLPLYIILLITLVKYRKTAFKTSFFKIFVSLGIADVCSMINIYIFVKGVTWKFLNNFFLWKPTLIATTSLCWTWQSYFAQLNGVLLLNINRFVALVYPTQYELLFSPERTNIFIAIQWIVSLILVAPRPFLTSTYMYQADNESLSFNFSASSVGSEWFFKFATFYCFFLCFSTIVLYGVMTVNVYLVRNRASNSQNHSLSNIEIRLLGVGFSVGVDLFFFGVYLMLMLFTNLDMAPLSLLYFITVDIFNEINPYSLILLCSEVRVHLAKFLFAKQDNKVHSIKSVGRNKNIQQKGVAESEM